jgi:hypothetical protein
MPRRHRKMKGGFWESLTQGVSDAWNKTKKATTDAYSSATGSTDSTSYTAPATPQPMTTPPAPQPMTTPPPAPTTSGYMGGRKKSRRMRGGYSDNIALTGLAASAAPISDIKTAQPLTTVGGKRRTKRHRRHRHSKSRKHYRH